MCDWEGGRTEVLVHGVGVVRPRLKVLCEDGEFLLEGLDVCWVLVEEDLFMSASYTTISYPGTDTAGRMNIQFQQQP